MFPAIVHLDGQHRRLDNAYQDSVHLDNSQKNTLLYNPIYGSTREFPLFAAHNPRILQ
jgi:hypothetical protein